jgi:hypothetical protein
MGSIWHTYYRGITKALSILFADLKAHGLFLNFDS